MQGEDEMERKENKDQGIFPGKFSGRSNLKCRAAAWPVNWV
jgi:hypothetical protein